MKRLATGFSAVILILAGCASPPSRSPTASPTSKLQPPTASSSPSSSAAPATAPPVPAGFKVEDLSFASGDAFALGSVDGVATLAESDDAGAIWHLVGTLPTTTCPTEGSPGPCLRLRFGSSGVGYAYGFIFLVTHDGGRHWIQQPSPQFTWAQDLAASGPSSAVRAHGSAPCGCTLQYTTDGGASWHDTGVSPVSDSNSTDRVLMQSDISYATQLGNPAGGGEGAAAIYVSTDNGRTWSTRATPCGQQPLTGDMAATTSHVVAVVCIDRTTQPGTLTLRVSTNGAVTFGGASAPVPSGGFQALLGLGSASVAAVGTDSGVYITTDGGAHWHRTLSCQPTWVGFESATEAHVICGDTVYRSNDAGETWQGYTFS